MKFACDIMLGALAKWLRVSGHDVFYSSSIDRSGLFRVAREEGRVILTRTGSYNELKEIPTCYIIDSDDVAEQLRIFYKLFPDIDPWQAMFTRCLECNAVLTSVRKEDVDDRLPPLVKERVTEVFHCPSCGKIYWHGTHVERMKSFLKQHVSHHT